MKTIPLTRGYFTVVDDEDYEYLSQFKWHYNQGYAHKNTRIAKNRWSQVGMQRVILARKLGRPPTTRELADHWDQNPLNNTRKNIRVATRAGNAINSKPRASGYKGVSKSGRQGKPWRARVGVGGRSITLGYFDTAEQAALAYNEAVLKHHGEFAAPNEVNSV